MNTLMTDSNGNPARGPGTSTTRFELKPELFPKLRSELESYTIDGSKFLTLKDPMAVRSAGIVLDEADYYEKAILDMILSSRSRIEEYTNNNPYSSNPETHRRSSRLQQSQQSRDSSPSTQKRQKIQ
jgi:hypothetical protein